MTTNISFTHIFLLIIPAFYLFGCDITGSKSDDQLPDLIDELVPVCTASDGIVDLHVYSDKAITTSYNRLFLDLFESGSENRIFESSLTITPVMDMGEHVHAAPVWQSGTNRNPDSGLFEAAIIPTMPGGTMGSWTLHWDAGNGVSAEPCDFDVDPSPKVKVFTAENGERYVLTWVRPQSPTTGANDLTFALHRRESMMSFPEVQDLQLEIRPWMDSMGHGSEGNEHPVPTGDGFYEGNVVFNMSGDWEVHVSVIANDELIHETTFELQVD